MRDSRARSQLALRWSDADDPCWDELPPPVRAELREMLRALLHRSVAGPGRTEAGHDE
ncbi:MAG: hypothetical protein ACREKS_00665 [Candidatus Rokuibacteriota bacterium]